MAQEPAQVEGGLTGTEFRNRVNEALLTVGTLHYGPNSPTEIAGELVENGLIWWDTSVNPNAIRLYLPGASGAVDGWVTWAYVNSVTGAVTAGPGLQAQLDLYLKADGSVEAQSLTMAAAYSVDTAKKVATKEYVDSVSRPADIRFALQGVASVQNNVFQVLVTRPCKFGSMMLYSGDAPTGASLTVVVTRKRTGAGDVSRSALLIAGQNESTTAVTELSLQTGDRLVFDISSVGSSVAGGNDLLVGIPLSPP